MGKQIWPKESMLIRGYETRRTDSFSIQIEALEDIFAKLMDRDIDNALEASRNWVTRVSEGDFDDKNFVISKTAVSYTHLTLPTTPYV